MTARVLVAASIGLIACGDDAAVDDTAAPPETHAPDASDSAPTSDTSASEDAPSEAGADTSAPDVSTPVQCGSVTCDEPPAPGCSPDRLARWSHEGEASCEIDAGGFPICRYPVSDERCADGDACRLEDGAPICAPPRETCEVALARAGSWISAVRLPTSEGDQCCRDFDGDGVVDNGLAALAQQIAPLFEADPQDFIDAFIRRGLNAYLVQYRRLDDSDHDADVGLELLLGFDADGNHDDNLLGTERFAVRAASFDGPTPKSRFTDANINAGRLNASAATMGFLLPLTDEPFVAEVADVRLEAAVTLGDNGRGLTLAAATPGAPGARFSALFPLREVYRAVNDFARGGCACLDLGGPDLIVATGNGWECTTADASACNPEDDDESICVDLATYCSAALVLLAPDVADSLSIGLWIQAVSAGFDGLVDATGAPLSCP